MKEVTKKVLLVVLMFAMLIALTGCANVNMEVKINRDGSADVAYVMGYDKDFLTSMSISKEDLASDDSLDESMQSAKDSGYTVEVYEDEETYGFKASKHIDDIAEFSMKDATGSSEEVVQNEGIIYEKSLFKKVISQETSMDLSTMSNNTDAQSAAMANMLLGQMNITYKVELPFKVDEHNATTVSEDGKTLQWNLKVGQENPIKFKASQDYTIFALIGAIMLIVIIALSVIIFAENTKNQIKEIINREQD